MKLLQLALFFALLSIFGCESVSRETGKALSGVGVSEQEQNEIKREYLDPVGDGISEALDSVGLNPEHMGDSLNKMTNTAKDLGKKGSRTMRNLSTGRNSAIDKKSLEKKARRAKESLPSELAEEALQERDERIEHF